MTILDQIATPLEGLHLFLTQWLFRLDERDGLSGPENETLDDDVNMFLSYQNGNNHAYRLLFQKWKLPLISFFYRSLGNREDAEELTLDVFKKLHQVRDSYRPTAKFSSFLFTIARRLLLNRLRSRKRKPLEIIQPDDLVYVASQSNDESPTVSYDLEQSISHSLAKLEEKFRTPLLLTLQQGMHPRDIAKIIGKSENSTRVLLHRARNKLKLILEESE